jgi:alcohol dehydrogenase
MKAAVIERQGAVENLVYRDWPEPEIAADEVLMRVKACALNYLDLEVRRGMPGFPIRTPFISGGDMAGVVEAVGAEVTRCKAGDAIVFNPFGRDGMMGEDCQGGLAELAKAPQGQVIAIPDGVGFEQAAALPVGYGTAHRIMFERARVEAGELVLILGAAGGVGTGCLQIAKTIGARTICVSSSPRSRTRNTRTCGRRTVPGHRGNEPVSGWVGCWPGSLNSRDRNTKSLPSGTEGLNKTTLATANG